MIRQGAPEMRDLSEEVAGMSTTRMEFDTDPGRQLEDRPRTRGRVKTVGLFVVAAAATLLLAGCGGGSSDRAQTLAGPGGEESGAPVTGPTQTGPAATGPTMTDPMMVAGPTYDPSDDFVGLPPEGAEPISLKDGRLIARAHEIHIGWVYLYADGRMISWSEGTFESPRPAGYREQLLRPEGAELLRSELLSTGLFDSDRQLSNRGGVLDAKHDLDRGFIEVSEGDRLVRVAWGDAASRDAITTPPTAKQALTLARFLYLDPSSVQASAWVDPTLRPYVPARYAICNELSDFPVAARDLLRGKEQLFDIAGPNPSDVGGVGQKGVYCFEIATEDARVLDGILADQGIESNLDVDGGAVENPQGFVYGEYVRLANYWPILPHGTFADQPG